MAAGAIENAMGIQETNTSNFPVRLNKFMLNFTTQVR
jgi:hypothetical protein